MFTKLVIQKRTTHGSSVRLWKERHTYPASSKDVGSKKSKMWLQTSIGRSRRGDFEVELVVRTLDHLFTLRLRDSKHVPLVLFQDAQEFSEVGHQYP